MKFEKVCMFLNICPLFKIVDVTGKSVSEALILESVNPQYEDRLFIELRVQYKTIASSEHVKNVLCTKIVLNVKTKKQFMYTTYTELAVFM